jgi:hypothetical protein
MFQTIITTEMADRVERHMCHNFYLKLETTVPETNKTLETDFKEEIICTGTCRSDMFYFKKNNISIKDDTCLALHCHHHTKDTNVCVCGRIHTDI